jgi:hypothetical protein
MADEQETGAPEAYDYIPTLAELKSLPDVDVIRKYDIAAVARAHAPASFFPDELRRRESAVREQESAAREERMVKLTRWITAMTAAILFASAVTVAASLVTVVNSLTGDPPQHESHHGHR